MEVHRHPHLKKNGHIIMVAKKTIQDLEKEN